MTEAKGNHPQRDERSVLVLPAVGRDTPRDKQGVWWTDRYSDTDRDRGDKTVMADRLM